MNRARSPLMIAFAVLFVFVSSFAAHAGEKTYTLREAYESAFKTHESVKIAEEGVAQSGAVVDQAWTYLYPRLDGRAGYTWYDTVLPPGATAGQIFQPHEEVTASLVLKQPLYTGGRTLAGLRTAQTLREASRADLSAAREDLMLGVAGAFYGVLKAQRLVEVSRDSVERMERNRKVTEHEANIRKSKANASALLRANTLVSQAGIILMRSEDGLRIARRKLALIAGLPEDAALTEPSPLEAPVEGYERLRDIAFENREDVAKARMNTEVASENVTIVRGAHLPQLFAEGGLRFKNAYPDTIDEGKTYYGGVRLEVPIFEGGLMNYQVAEAKSKLRQSQLAASLVRRSIEDDVYEASVTLQTDTAVLASVRQQYDDAKSNFSTVESLYADGLASSLQLIDAQQALLLAEQEYVNALYDHEVSILRLKRAVGLLGKEERKG